MSKDDKDIFIQTEMTPITIPTLIQEIHRIARSKGFHETTPVFGKDTPNTRHILSLLMLLTTEVGEAAEAARKSNLENFTEELADVAIRLFDIAGLLHIDLETAIVNKMQINWMRPYKHGNNLC